MRTSSEPFDIVLCADAGYRQHLAVTMMSVLSCTEPRRCRFWIITDHSSSDQFSTIINLAKDTGAEANLISLSPGDLPAPTEGSYYTSASLYRLFFPQLIPSSVSWALYLDADVVVKRNLKYLFAETDKTSAVICAARNAGGSNDDLGLKSAEDYFNAGVMLVNIERWKSLEITTRVLALMKAGRCEMPFYDQDGINGVVAGQWHRIDLRWNQQYEHFLVSATEMGLDQATVRAIQGNPFIIHYSGAAKPWHYRDDHPYRYEYFKYLAKTPFREWRPSATSWKDRLRRWARRQIPLRSRRSIHGWVKCISVTAGS